MPKAHGSGPNRPFTSIQLFQSHAPNRLHSSLLSTGPPQTNRESPQHPKNFLKNSELIDSDTLHCYVVTGSTIARHLAGKRTMGTDPDTNTYQLTLDQLCQQAGVTVRTVRYYISEGLLPPPQGQGPAARYGDIHLQRLLVIAQLKEQYLPLREIRRVLDGLDEAGIATLAAAYSPDRQSMAEATPMNSPAAPSPAAAYIEDLLGQSSSTPRLVSRARMAAPEPTDKAWRRLPISDDAELLIEADLYERRQEQIDSLISWAKRLLSGS